MGRVYITPVEIWSKRLKKLRKRARTEHKRIIRDEETGPVRLSNPKLPGSFFASRSQQSVFEEYQRELKREGTNREYSRE